MKKEALKFIKNYGFVDRGRFIDLKRREDLIADIQDISWKVLEMHNVIEDKNLSEFKKLEEIEKYIDYISKKYWKYIDVI